MIEFDVVLLTDSRYVNPKNPNLYVQNILKEDRLVAEALHRRGLRVAKKDWADPDFNWASTKAALFRTTWDYSEKVEAFRNWLNKASKQTQLIHSKEMIEWNLDKHYLQELQEKGVRIIPTKFIDKGEKQTLGEIINACGWREVVLKPTEGAGGVNTYRIDNGTVKNFESRFKKLISEQGFMLQPFQESITEIGEWSYVAFGKSVSHSVVKKAKAGEFRVQDDFGGAVYPYHPSEAEIEFVLHALDKCPGNPVYARIDVVKDNEGKLAISEIELIEPELWFRLKPEAADLLADKILSKINRSE